MVGSLHQTHLSWLLIIWLVGHFAGHLTTSLWIPIADDSRALCVFHEVAEFYPTSLPPGDLKRGNWNITRPHHHNYKNTLQIQKYITKSKYTPSRPEKEWFSKSNDFTKILFNQDFLRHHLGWFLLPGFWSSILQTLHLLSILLTLSARWGLSGLHHGG